MKKAFMSFAVVLALLAPLAAQSVTVTSPNGDESWPLNSSHAITWTSRNAGSVKVSIVLRSGDSRVGTIKSNVDLSAGSWTWETVGKFEDGSKAPVGTGYVVRIRDAAGTFYDDSNKAFAIAAAAPTVVHKLPIRPLPIDIILKLPRLEVTAINLVCNAGGFAIIFNYKNAGNAPMPKASEVPVKPDYRVHLDGQETARGSLYIPTFPAEPGWEQWGYNGGQVDLPTWKSYVMDGLPLHDKYFYMMQWHVGDRVTVHINENKVMGMSSHELTKDLRPILIEHYYDLGIGGVAYDWPSHTLSISVRLAGKIPLNRSFDLVCVNQYLPSHVWSVIQPMNRRDFSFSEKVAVPDGVNEARFEVFLLLDRTGDQRIDDIDMRNNYLLVNSQRAQ